MRLDIVIPAFNSVDLTWRCLQHIILFPPKTFVLPRIVLIDNASTDDTPLLGEWLKSRHHVYVRNEKNGGPYVAWNQGIEIAKKGSAERIVFLNNDVSVLPGCLQSLCESPFAYTCVTEVIGDYRAPELLLYADSTVASNGQDPRYKSGYLHSCFAVDLDLLESVGGFDERFFLTYGDTDFMVRAKDVCNVTPRVDTKAVVHHGVSMTRRREFGVTTDIFHDQRDHVRFTDKYKDRPEVLEAHPPISVDRAATDRQSAWADGERT